MNDIELKLLEEFNKLQAYAVENPVDKKGFWEEWQKLFTKVKFQQIAVKALIHELDKGETATLRFLDKKLKVLRELELYLKELKDVALQVKGYSIFATEESGEEDDDFDDFPF